MKPTFLPNHLIAIGIVLYLSSHCHAVNDAESEIENIAWASLTECPHYGPMTKLVAYFGNHLSAIIDGKENVFFSPYSISISLAMVYLGSRGQTARDMEISLGYNQLNISNPAEDIHEIFQDSFESLESAAESYSLAVANGLFIQNGYNVSFAYIRDLENFYSAEVLFEDFKYDGERAVSEINNWVANHTEGNIERLLEEPMDPMTVLLLANAVYFKGIWKYTFASKLTVERKFYSMNVTKMVPFMEFKNTVLSFQDDSTNFTFLELDYKDEQVSMILALPYHRNQFPKLEITTTLMCRIRKNFRPSKMHVMIPRFNLKYERELSNDLFHLGLGDLFSGERANLTGIRRQNDLVVSAMIHKAVIEVNEEGSVASAASGVTFHARSGHTRYNLFKADHPFLFSIIDKRTGIILFMGRIVNF